MFVVLLISRARLALILTCHTLSSLSAHSQFTFALFSALYLHSTCCDAFLRREPFLP